MNYFKDFDSFVFPKGSSMINEGLMDNGKIIRETFIKKGSRTVTVTKENGEKETVTIDPKEIVDTVEDAIKGLSFDFGSFFDFVSEFTIIYFWFDKHCKTMCVDDHMNIYISAPFVRFGLKMNKRLIAAVVMHEILHVAFNHLERGKRWLVSQNKSYNKETAHDNNLAADIEVNIALTQKDIISSKELVSEIKGLYLQKYSSNVPPMETVLEDEDAMRELRLMSPLDEEEKQPPKENQNVKTTKEFDEGYVEMKNKIADIVNKYGPEKAIEKLREIGAVSGVEPTVSDDIDFNDVLSMNFIVLKTFEEFINESNGTEQFDGFSTKEDGYREAIRKSLGEIMSSLNQDDMEGEDEGDDGDDSGQEIESGINQDDLKPMNLPGKKGKKSNGKGKSLPSNVNQSSDGEDTEGDESKDSSGNSNGDNKEGEEGKDSSGNKESKGGKGNSKGGMFTNDGNNSEIEVSFGGLKTGEFTDSKSSMAKSLRDTIKDSYGKDFEKIMDVIKENESLNTNEMVERKREAAFNSLSSGDKLKALWKNSKDNEKKYKAMWKKILKEFLSLKTRRAGEDVRDNRIKWGEKRRMSIGMISPKNLKKAQDNQDLNVYVDISGSVDMKLLELVAQSLTVFLKQYKYSGINVIPWGTNSNGSHRVNPISKIGTEKAAAEIISYIEDGRDTLSRGTELRGACVPELIKNIESIRKREEADDIQIIISDGDTGDDQNGIEELIYSVLTANGNPNRLSAKNANIAVKNCIWMLYDCRNEESWKRAIKNGKLVFISSKNFIPE